MNLSIFTKVKVGNFATYLENLTDSLPDFMAGEREELRKRNAEMQMRLNADRRNSVLRELVDKDLPVLRLYVRYLDGQLRLLERRNALGEKDMIVYKCVRQRFRARRKVVSMVTDALFLATLDEPEDESCAQTFAMIRELAAEMDAKCLRSGEEEARIKSIGGSLEIRDEALRIVRRVKDRAQGAIYETGDAVRQREGREVIETLETLISIARRSLPRKKKKDVDAPYGAGNEGDNGKIKVSEGMENGALGMEKDVSERAKDKVTGMCSNIICVDESEGRRASADSGRRSGDSVAKGKKGKKGRGVRRKKRRGRK